MQRSLSFVFARDPKGQPLLALPLSKSWRGAARLQFVFSCGSTPCVVYLLPRPFAGQHWVALRRTRLLLSPTFYRLAAKAWHLMLFKQTHVYCGECGNRNTFTIHQTIRCQRCGHEHWPHFAPAVIVLITRNRGSEALFLSSRNFRDPNYYGLLAGYVEPGETLEQCLEREIREETGLSVTDINYFASQPWPTSGAIMVAYTARYLSGILRLQQSELRAGGWFTRDQLPPHIPARDSIARHLIDAWLNRTLPSQERRT